MEQNEPLCGVTITVSWKYFYQKLTQFSQGNNELVLQLLTFMVFVLVRCMYFFISGE
jgi:hypothetical protein